MTLKFWFFYNIRLPLGRLERCHECNKLLYNNGAGLYDSLYYENNCKKDFGKDSEQYKEMYKRSMICKKCSKRDNNAR
jgi:hypothetical protein